jgi:hypothetical protein
MVEPLWAKMLMIGSIHMTLWILMDINFLNNFGQNNWVGML